MAVKPVIVTQDFQGLSTDTKPTQNVSVGSGFFEEDTNTYYVFTTAGAWQAS